MKDDSTKCRHPKKAVKFNPYNKVTQCHKCGKVIKNHFFEDGQLDVICYVRILLCSLTDDKLKEVILLRLQNLEKEIKERKKVLGQPENILHKGCNQSNNNN